MPQIKLVLSDMDGTLMPFGAHEVSARTMAGIATLREAGIAFGPSSGRERSDLIRYFHGDELSVATGIMGNGKLVYLDGELVYRRPLPRDQVEALAQAVSEHPGVMLNLYRPLDEHGHGEAGFISLGISEREKGLFPYETDINLVDALPDGDITTCAVIIAPEVADVDEIHEAVSAACPRLDFPFPAPAVFDVLERGWSKVSALPILLDHLGIDANQIAYLDKLTGIPNRYSCDLIFQNMDTPDKVKHVGCFLLSIKNLIEIHVPQVKSINFIDGTDSES